MTRLAVVAGMLLAVSAWPLKWNAEFAAKERGRHVSDAYMEELGRIGKESLLASNDLMLLSYLKNLRQAHPEIEYATVWRSGHVVRFGERKDGIAYRGVRASTSDASRSIV